MSDLHPQTLPAPDPTATGTPKNWYLVIPVAQWHEPMRPLTADVAAVLGTAQVFLVNATKANDAAQRAYAAGYPFVGVAQVDFYRQT